VGPHAYISNDFRGIQRRT